MSTTLEQRESLANWFQTASLLGQHVEGEYTADTTHEIAIGAIKHLSGAFQSVLEVRERHGEEWRTRRFAISTIVHALLNLERDEEFELEARGKPPSAEKMDRMVEFVREQYTPSIPKDCGRESCERCKVDASACCACGCPSDGCIC